MSCPDQMLSDAALRSALENPCLTQGQEMECAPKFGVTTFNKCICLAALPCFLCKPSLCAHGRKNLFTGMTAAHVQGHITHFWVCALRFFNEMLPKSSSIRFGSSVSHQYSSFEFHHLYRSLEITALQGFHAWSQYLHTIYSFHHKKKKR